MRIFCKLYFFAAAILRENTRGGLHPSDLADGEKVMIRASCLIRE
jgi:hypothetical protein